ncbi:MAG: DUF6364 family protein [Prolixibacteraceae bacterium]|jgi:hypothetical protein
MKSRLNITIDEALAEQAKRYAARHDISVSQLVEQYFRNLARPAHKKNILDVVKKLPKPAISIEGDGKEAYYQQQKEKYGF